MMKVLRDWFTGPNNDHYEAGRALWFLSVVNANALAGWHLYKNGQFDIMLFGTGIAALIAAGGWGIGAKDKAAKAARDA